MNPGLALIKSLQTLRACVKYEYGKGLTQKETIQGVAWVTLSVPLEQLAGRQRKIMEERAEKDNEETSGRK